MGVATKDKSSKSVMPNTLESNMIKVKETVMWHCGLDEEQLFWAVIDAGQYYLKGRVNEADYKMMVKNKGFWHWYNQVWCLSAKWLIDANGWEILDKYVPEQRYNYSLNSKDFGIFNKYLCAKLDSYSYEPVLIAMYNGVVYDGRVFW